MIRSVLIAGIFLLSASIPSFPAPQSPADYQTEALNAFQRGDVARAITLWQDAAQGYERLRQPRPHAIVLTHLAHAYQALGLFDKAVQHLEAALQRANEAGDRPQMALLLGDLGYMQAIIGHQQEANRLLDDAIAQSNQLDDRALTASLLYTRGHLLIMQQKRPEALAAYRQSAALAQQAQRPDLEARSLVNAAVSAEREQQRQAAMALLETAATTLQRVPVSSDTAAEWVSIGRVYHRLAATQPPLIRRAAEAYEKAANIAQRLNDLRNLSYAWGYLGQLYERKARFSEALTLTRRAALAAQSIPESLYLWQWQTGRLLAATEQARLAIEAYERAIDTVQSMRTALLRRLRPEPNAFRQTLGAMYFEYANLLLQQADALQTNESTTAQAQYEAYLHRAQDAIERFKTQELREYFGDECVDTAYTRTITVDQVSSDTVVIYPILLEDRVELLVSLGSELKRVVLPVSGPLLETRVQHFRHALEDGDPLRYLRHAQQLHAWLIQPLTPWLQTYRIQTIVLVPDGMLRLLPIAALHDGKQYLIEQYAVAITPSLMLTEPQSLPRDNLNVLAAGLSEPVAGLPALPQVAEEIHNISQLFDATVLLDQNFNPERLHQTVQQGDFSIIHIAAHGHFASDATQSFLLTGEGKLSFQQLTQIVRRLRFRKQPLELLTLSACDTAQGDDQAALGLAGIAIQAGARSAVLLCGK